MSNGREVSGHGGQLALAALRAFGVDELFTLSGGHVFPLYDAAHQAGVRIVDVRHEQSAVFAAAVRDAVTAALTPHRGPVFLDFPLEVLFGTGEGDVGEPRIPVVEPDPDEVARAAALIAAAHRPVLIAGSDVYAGDAVDALRAAAEAFQVPVFANGMGRGALPPGHPLAFARARRVALSGADLVVVVGTALDFRLGFGDFGDARVVHVVDAASQRATHVTPAAAPAGDLRTILTGFAAFTGDREDHTEWVGTLRAAEDKARARDAEAMAAGTDPIK